MKKAFFPHLTRLALRNDSADEDINKIVEMHHLGVACFKIAYLSLEMDKFRSEQSNEMSWMIKLGDLQFVCRDLMK